MALKSGLTLYCYTLPSATPPVVRAYSAELDSLTFTTIAPGGMASLSCKLSVPDARLPHPELALFARCALVGRGETGPFCLFLGELATPTIGMESGAEYIQLTALGLGNALRDDPLSVSYSLQTAKQIATAQLFGRSAYLPIDQDTTALFPDNPTATFSPAYDGRKMEEVVQDLCTLSGDYTWGVWPHTLGYQPGSRHVDAVGMPTAQLQIHQRDTATTHYTASVAQGDVTAYGITPANDRAYNVIEIGYNNGGSGYGRATYTDPRLNGDGSQGTAPFRRRKMMRDLSGTSTIGATQAQGIANAFGPQYSNVTNKNSITLSRVRDANGNRIPLWTVMADRNIFVPEMAVRGAQLPTVPTAGVNQFYIVQATYSETAKGQQLVLQADNFVDAVNTQIARLSLQADLQARSGKTTATLQTLGAVETGTCGASTGGVSVGAGTSFGTGVGFRAIMAQVPVSITFAANGTTSNAGSPTASAINCFGFYFSAQATATGAAVWNGSYQTNGNTLHALHAEQGRVTWHCSACDGLHSGLVIAGRESRLHVAHHPAPEWRGAPGLTGLAITCPRCGMVESFNTALVAADEDERTPGNYAHRAGQARLIRQLMRHPLLGLTVRG